MIRGRTNRFCGLSTVSNGLVHACGRFIAIADALDSHSNGASPKPEVLTLELRGQNLTQQVVESVRHLGIPTILLGGNAELNDPLIREHKWDMVLKRPFSL